MKRSEIKYVIQDTIQQHLHDTNEVIQLYVARRLAKLGVLVDFVDWLPDETRDPMIPRTLVVQTAVDTFKFDILTEPAK